jgi:hypothetical protein
MCQIHSPGMATPFDCVLYGICDGASAIAHVCRELALQGTKVPTALAVLYTLPYLLCQALVDCNWFCQ